MICASAAASADMQPVMSRSPHAVAAQDGYACVPRGRGYAGCLYSSEHCRQETSPDGTHQGCSKKL